MEDVSNILYDIIGLSPRIQAKLVASIIGLMVIWMLRKVAYRIINQYYHTNVHARYQSRKTVGYVLFSSSLLLVGWIWFEGVGSLATFLGLASAGLVIALKDLLIDLAGWIFIIWRQPFRVGDRIQLGEFAGDVIDIRPFQFTLLEIGNWVDADQSTGRVIHVPNGKVFHEAQASYTEGFQYIWDEITVTITFESNWQKARKLLLEIVNRHVGHLGEKARGQIHEATSKYLIFYSKLTPIVYTSVKESGVVLTIRYLSEPRRRRGNMHTIWEDILSTFATCDDISFAYPTQRIYFTEGQAAPRHAEQVGHQPARENKTEPWE